MERKNTLNLPIFHWINCLLNLFLPLALWTDNNSLFQWWITPEYKRHHLMKNNIKYIRLIILCDVLIGKCFNVTFLKAEFFKNNWSNMLHSPTSLFPLLKRNSVCTMQTSIQISLNTVKIFFGIFFATFF